MIYGAGSIVGRAFAKYLASKGFGLILIDMSLDRVKQTEIYLQQSLETHLNIKMIVASHKNGNGSIDSEKLNWQV